MGKQIMKKKRREMTKEELFEKVWEVKGIEIIETSFIGEKLLIQEYFKQKYKNWNAEALKNEAVEKGIETDEPASRKGKTKKKTNKKLKQELVAKMVEDTPSIAASDLQKEITKFYFDERGKKDKQYAKN